mmetsp:Transcript_69981/g.130841  ORF Transcript_69981/g.130841 Transcript_69981/m.130841 type:complete len:217 (+) Transcript_69981:129-779(+)
MDAEHLRSSAMRQQPIVAPAERLVHLSHCQPTQRNAVSVQSQDESLQGRLHESEEPLGSTSVQNLDPPCHGRHFPENAALQQCPDGRDLRPCSIWTGLAKDNELLHCHIQHGRKRFQDCAGRTQLWGAQAHDAVPEQHTHGNSTASHVRAPSAARRLHQGSPELLLSWDYPFRRASPRWQVLSHTLGQLPDAGSSPLRWCPSCSMPLPLVDALRQK